MDAESSPSPTPRSSVFNGSSIRPSTFRPSTIRPSVPPKPSHLHSLSVRANPYAHAPIPQTFFRGVPVQVVRTGLVKQRLGQLAAASGPTRDEDWEKDKEEWRLERERKRAAAELKRAQTVGPGSQRAHTLKGVRGGSGGGGGGGDGDGDGGTGGSTLKVAKPRSRKTSAKAIDRFFRQHAVPSPQSADSQEPAQTHRQSLPQEADDDGDVGTVRLKARHTPAHPFISIDTAEAVADDVKGASTPQMLLEEPRTSVTPTVDAVVEGVDSPPDEPPSTGSDGTLPDAGDARKDPKLDVPDPSLLPDAGGVAPTGPTLALPPPSSVASEASVLRAGSTTLRAPPAEGTQSMLNARGSLRSRPPSFFEATTRRLSTLTFLTAPLPAVALHTFVPAPPPASNSAEEGDSEAFVRATKEVGFEVGDRLEVLVEDVGGGWSLGRALRGEAEGQPSGEEVGLIPRGWYEFLEDLEPETADALLGAPPSSSPSSTPSQPPRSYTSSPLASVLPPSMLDELYQRSTAEGEASAPAADPPAPSLSTTADRPVTAPPASPSAESVASAGSDAADDGRAPKTRPSKRIRPPRITSVEERVLLSPNPDAAHDSPPALAAEAPGPGKVPDGPAVSVKASEAMWQHSAGIAEGSKPKGKAKAKAKARAKAKGSLFGWAAGPWESTGAMSYVLDGPACEDADERAAAPASPLPGSDPGSAAAAASGSGPGSVSSAGKRGGRGGGERFEVEAGPAWKVCKPLYAVQVHSPVTKADEKRREHTVFAVTTTFWDEDGPEGGSEEGAGAAGQEGADMVRTTVDRRYSHFERLAVILAAKYPGLVLPALPEKQYAGRFGAAFLETRRRGLERYLLRLVRHPLLRHSEPLTAFLTCAADAEWEAFVARSSADPPGAEEFWGKIWHPEWNVEREAAGKEVERFARLVKATEQGGGVTEVENAVGRVRSAMRDLSEQMNELSRAVLRLTAGMALPASAPRTPLNFGDEDDEDDERDYVPPDALAAHKKRARAEAMQTTDGAWCWREACYDCLALTKALQHAGVAIGEVADVYLDNAERGLAPAQELLRECHNPQRQHRALLDLHRSTARGATGDDDGVEARRDTVLNVTLSEIERYHSERAEDFCDFSERFLDEQLDLHSKAYEAMRSCRAHFSAEPYASLALSGPRPPNAEELLLLESSRRAAAAAPGSSRFSVLAGWSSAASVASSSPQSEGGHQAASYAGSVASTLWGKPVAAMASSVVGIKDLFSDRG